MGSKPGTAIAAPKRLKVLLGLVPTMAALGIVTVAATPAHAAAASDFRLTKSQYSGLIGDLDARLPNVTVADVVNDGNRTGSRCYPTMSNLDIAFCWNSGDQSTLDWTPQGITTSGDATGTGKYQGKTAILTSWYYSGGGTNKGVRISFVNYANTSSPTYRHVLLVEPTGTADAPSFRPVTVHAGGIAWYGNYLYVADTSYGFRVFDMNHLWRVSTGNEGIIGRQSDGTYHAFNYKYVLPQAFRYTQSTVNGAAALRFSTVSVARTGRPHSLAIAEWADDGYESGKRLARFDLGADRLLATDADGLVHADAVYTISQSDIQGTSLVHGKYYLSQTDGPNARGNLGIYTPGGSLTWKYDYLPDGTVESQSYWPGRDQLWSLTEYAGKRRVFATRLGYTPIVGAALSDYTGDGISDIAVFRSSTGEWIRYGSVMLSGWGGPGDVPLAGDYTGDGITDFAVFRPSTGEWIRHGSIMLSGWGGPGDMPLSGDYDGDGRTDIAVFRPSTGEWIRHGSIMLSGWGEPGDIPVAGDYTGDGVTDFAVFRPATGEWIVWGLGTLLSGWGSPGDIPVAGDYDGDGKTEFALFRPSTGEWSRYGTVMVTGWAGPGDLPTAASAPTA